MVFSLVMGREETRQRLLDAAAELFLEKGLGSTSLEDIARQAGLTKGAVYSNFASKEELFVEMLRIGEPSSMDVSAFAGDAPLGEKVRGWGRYLAGLGDHRVTASNLEQAAMAIRNERARAIYAEMVRSVLVPFGETIPDLPPFTGTEVVVLLDALVQGLLVRRALDPELVPGDLVERAIAVLICGILLGEIDADAALATRLEQYGPPA
ncbi:MAG TPA: TetR family transcriptional regulator [Acidimicrobiales bacterium]|nr:TetR family transcriptional regulator [Acidimicrobiales bacterium]